MKALVRAPFDARYLERLGESFDVTYENWTESRKLLNPNVMAARLRDEKIVALIVEADFLTADVFAAPSLRVAGVCRNGLNLVDLPAATENGIPVLNALGRNAIAVAEMTLGLMLAITRRIPAAHEYVMRGDWTDPIDPYVTYRGREVSGSVVGVIGFGGIGQEVTRRVQALGARVVAHDPFAKPKRAEALGVRLVSLPQLLRKSDFVTLHTAQTPETEHLIDGPAIDLMKPTAFLISTGAANIVDEEALADRLRARTIAGAALDVFRGHMVSTSSPLLKLDNVILTPHLGGATPETVTRQSKMIVEDIERFFRGEKPRRVANPDALAKAGHAG